MTRLGKIAGRFVPGAGAAMAPIEFEAMLRESRKNTPEGMARALVHGIGGAGGVLQATAIPPLVGLGDILQIPSVGLGVYDIGNEYLNKQTKP